jgi:hypothetical protein
MNEPARYTYDVFISYSHTDKDWVQGQLLPWLEKAGLKVIIDSRDFEVGVASIVNMERAVDNSRHTLVVLTPAWVNSAWTEFESLLISTADPTGRSRRILPLMLQQCKPPARISMLTYADFTNLDRCGEEMARLLRSLRASGGDTLSGNTQEAQGPLTLPSTDKQSSYLVDKGLNVLIELIQAPAVRTAVITFQADFQATSEQINILTNYKHLHDLFQELEYLYDIMDHDQRRLPNDDTAWESLMRNEPELQDKIDELLDVAKHAPFATDEARWMEQLTQTQNELRAAVEDCNLAQLKAAHQHLHRVLDRQPSRINRSLVVAARNLRLNALAKAMTTVCDSLLDSDLNLEAVRQFEAGVNALDRLDGTLAGLVRDHNGWQEIDDELRRVEANLVGDISELEAAWPDLQNMGNKLYGESITDDWAISLRKTSTDLENTLADKVLVKVKQSFRRYRSQTGRRFRRVDNELLKLCQDLQKIGESLNLLLRVIQ